MVYNFQLPPWDKPVSHARQKRWVQGTLKSCKQGIKGRHAESLSTTRPDFSGLVQSDLPDEWNDFRDYLQETLGFICLLWNT